MVEMDIQFGLLMVTSRNGPLFMCRSTPSASFDHLSGVQLPAPLSTRETELIAACPTTAASADSSLRCG